MTTISVDEAMKAQLASLNTPAELRDENGKTLGFALSPDEYHRYVEFAAEQRRQDYEWAKTVISDEELDIALAEADADGVEFTHEEVMDHIRRLEEQERTKAS